MCNSASSATNLGQFATFAVTATNYTQCLAARTTVLLFWVSLSPLLSQYPTDTSSPQKNIVPGTTKTPPQKSTKKSVSGWTTFTEVVNARHGSTKKIRIENNGAEVRESPMLFNFLLRKNAFIQIVTSWKERQSELVLARLKSIEAKVLAIEKEPITPQLITKLTLLDSTATAKNNDFDKLVNKLFGTVPLPEELDESENITTISTLQDEISDLYVSIHSLCVNLIPSPSSNQSSQPNLDDSNAAISQVATTKLDELTKYIESHCVNLEAANLTNVGSSLKGNTDKRAPSSDSNKNESGFVGLTNTENTVLLATALIVVKSSEGKTLVCRGVLDSAAQSTFITQRCAQSLGIKRSHANKTLINGISSAQVKTKGLTHVTLQSLSGYVLASSHPVFILDNITPDLPRAKITPEVRSQMQHLMLADPTFDKPAPIDVLIGADLFASSVKGQFLSLGENMPVAIDTIFGYALLGSTPVASTCKNSFHGLVTLLTTNSLDLHTSIQQFWAVEEPPLTSKQSFAEEKCEKHFVSTHSRTPEGRYIVSLPFSDDPSTLGNSSKVAKSLFWSLENKFRSNPDFKETYVDFMRDYLSSGHITLCQSPRLKNNPHYYLPHHGIFKDGKLRVVFNASAPTSTSLSLNSILHQGPKLHNNICDIILNFRRHAVVFSCDIKQMFRQVLVKESDQIFQLIFWRENDKMPLQIYQLATVTYGLTSSPYLANRVIQQLIIDEGKNHPLAATALKDQIYVDDALLGWLTPVTFWSKSFMQYLWTLGLDWDEPLDDSVISVWNKFANELPYIEMLKIPRYVGLSSAKDIQLHAFSDASEAGYCSCVYLRVVNSQGIISTYLLIAKSRVAPLKRISIPRLELCGAHLMSKLLNYCIQLLSPHCKISSYTAWCDSTIVLSWIGMPSYRLKVYVSNRVAEIQENIPPSFWQHISSLENPADVGSRGTAPQDLINHTLWWNGPVWLCNSEENWPKSVCKSLPEESIPETKILTVNTLSAVPDEPFSLLTRFSSWTTLLHVSAYLLRFIHNTRNKVKQIGNLTSQEIKEAHNLICKLVQREYFSEEISCLKSNKPCSVRIRRLAPYLDKDGLIRVGGRINKADISEDHKHPVLLPKGHRCKPPHSSPLMGELPMNRVTPSRPFSISGVDYAGHFFVKQHLLRRVQPIKVYICIFICFSTKAVHIEVVTDLTADAYLAALTRFVSRRGIVSDIHCDNATNFTGASEKLRRNFENLIKDSTVQCYAENFNIKFHFLPPHAPHQGGLWERAVKSVKFHLIRVIGQQTLSLEEFSTLITRIEGMMNSRPITPLSSDPSDLEALTPGHFLVGGPLMTPLEPDLRSIPINRLKRWQVVQQFSQHIWARWQKEYLYTL
ncbi:uncharacterized protein LOC128984709 [Macrosteles quadrilineatus]|uniref:uncharacterized protein LOC128984709 n=1 Tax=Macrosteles quadrilineatus TaxID=74068 RepID=UPI0023E2A13D|nr:uncharacterized protein LOC128984709 [Macrosteles quadrilineatus]